MKITKKVTIQFGSRREAALLVYYYSLQDAERLIVTEWPILHGHHHDAYTQALNYLLALDTTGWLPTQTVYREPGFPNS